MQVGEFMTRKLITVEPDDSLEKIRQIFDNILFHHLLVVYEQKLMGVISDRDLLRHISPFVGSMHETSRDMATLKKRAHQIMTHDPITLPPEATLQDAVTVFREHPLSCIPITGDNLRPLGIITWHDLLQFVHD